MSNRILSHIQDKENEMKTSGVKRKGLTDENARVLSTKDSGNKQQQKSFANRRVPLGGKNHNSNNLVLNRSQSSLNSKIPVQPFNKPPTLTKSNSSLGFSAPLLQQLQEQQQVPPTIHQEEQPPTKKMMLESLKDEVVLGRESSMPDSFTDCLSKKDTPLLSPTVSLSNTFSTNTDRLHASNIIQDDINRNNVDPVKKQQHKQRDIDALVASHWQDPIETIPESTIPVKYNLDPLSESDLQFFSTPNESFDLNDNAHKFAQADKSFELDFGDDSSAGDVAIIHDSNEEIGLDNEDLNNLLG
ncbi:hypothetical protein Cantr_00976 [Candida viswanathii]|uniref:Uncharacterized protein n=1 Tax=Candida viswanathii TaxID=5486 RepID=A0A367YIZ8_9ASCO|nr:hypothetical protein Cantr_00976 [Candida viswanathii]